MSTSRTGNSNALVLPVSVPEQVQMLQLEVNNLRATQSSALTSEQAIQSQISEVQGKIQGLRSAEVADNEAAPKSILRIDNEQG